MSLAHYQCVYRTKSSCYYLEMGRCFMVVYIIIESTTKNMTNLTLLCDFKKKVHVSLGGNINHITENNNTPYTHEKLKSVALWQP